MEVGVAYAALGGMGAVMTGLGLAAAVEKPADAEGTPGKFVQCAPEHTTGNVQFNENWLDAEREAPAEPKAA